MRKFVFGVFDQDIHKTGSATCTLTEDSFKLEISDIRKLEGFHYLRSEKHVKNGKKDVHVYYHYFEIYWPISLGQSKPNCKWSIHK